MKKAVRTCSIQVFMAGDIAVAKHALRTMAWSEGMCVTITPTDFIYTGGEETGFVIGVQHYPRFPSTPKKLTVFAEHVAEMVMLACCQKTALVVAPKYTRWLTQKAPAEGVRPPTNPLPEPSPEPYVCGDSQCLCFLYSRDPLPRRDSDVP
jgi:hypothetical protein